MQIESGSELLYVGRITADKDKIDILTYSSDKLYKILLIQMIKRFDFYLVMLANHTILMIKITYYKP